MKKIRETNRKITFKTTADPTLTLTTLRQKSANLKLSSGITIKKYNGDNRYKRSKLLESDLLGIIPTIQIP